MHVKGVILKVLFYLSMLALAVFFLFPIYWIFASSFKPIEEIMSAKPRLIPERPTLEHYMNLFNPSALYGGLERAGKFFLFFIQNSLIVSSASTGISLILAALGGYALSRYRFKGSQLIARSMLLVYLFPGVLLIVPLYEMVALMRLTDTHLALIIVYVALTAPFGVWLLKAFFDAVPVELEEAAMVDGASGFQAFTRIVLPLSRPGLLTVLAYSFITCWGEYLFATILIFSDFKKTVAPGLAMYMGYQYIEWGSLLAGATLCTLPVLALFIPLSKYFLRELISGAMKF
jgi:ABC-type glycerol-3-phosphate transport system permease component